MPHPQTRLALPLRQVHPHPWVLPPLLAPRPPARSRTHAHTEQRQREMGWAAACALSFLEQQGPAGLVRHYVMKYQPGTSPNLKHPALVTCDQSHALSLTAGAASAGLGAGLGAGLVTMGFATRSKVSCFFLQSPAWEIAV